MNRSTYVDSSVLVAIVSGEPSADELRNSLETCEQVFAANLLEAELRSATLREMPCSRPGPDPRRDPLGAARPPVAPRDRARPRPRPPARRRPLARRLCTVPGRGPRTRAVSHARCKATRGRGRGRAAGRSGALTWSGRRPWRAPAAKPTRCHRTATAAADPQTLLPEHAAPGWVAAIVGPLYAVFLVVMITILNQMTGNLVLVAGIVCLMIAPLVLVRAARELLRRSSSRAASCRRRWRRSSRRSRPRD